MEWAVWLGDEAEQHIITWESGDSLPDTIQNLIRASLEDNETVGLPRSLNPLATDKPDAVTMWPIFDAHASCWATLDRDGLRTGQPDPRPEQARTYGSDGRWMVVDRHGAPVITGMYRRSNAQNEADELNATGVPEGRPYTVTKDTTVDA